MKSNRITELDLMSPAGKEFLPGAKSLTDKELAGSDWDQTPLEKFRLALQAVKANNNRHNKQRPQHKALENEDSNYSFRKAQANSGLAV